MGYYSRNLQASRAVELTRELHGHLPATIDDAFRAELLLGYVAGLPRREIEDPGTRGQRYDGDGIMQVL